MSKLAEITEKERFLQEFDEAFSAFSNDPLYILRKKALDIFCEEGVPTTRNENWKYTRVKPLLSKDYKIAENNKSARKEKIEHLISVAPSAKTVVFINGYYCEPLSTIATDKEIQVGLLTSNAELLEKHYCKYAPNEGQPFVSLNTAFSEPVYIRIPRNKIVEEPINIIHITDSVEEPVMCFPRLLIVCEENSQAKITETFCSLASSFYGFSSSVSEVVVKENSSLDLYKVQNLEADTTVIDFTQVYQQSNSRCSVHTISLEGSFIRNNLHFRLDGNGCDTHMYGLYLVRDKCFIDNHTFADHSLPNSFSNEVYKGIMEGKSTGVFNGKIMVRQDAQKTNAYQSNSNILLSDEANIYTKPELEIFADDVKCSHGATTGQLDKDALFYLKARGISDEKARAMLITAFAADILETIKVDSLKEKLLSEIEKRFDQGGNA